MIEFYPEIRLAHIVGAVASGSLFALRGLAQLTGLASGKAAALRFLSYTIDTVLLTSALMLATILHQYPFVHAWLTAKVLLLAVYIGFGIVAFRLAESPRAAVASWIGGLLVFAFIVSVARARDPLGLLAALAG